MQFEKNDNEVWETGQRSLRKGKMQFIKHDNAVMKNGSTYIYKSTSDNFLFDSFFSILGIFNSVIFDAS